MISFTEETSKTHFNSLIFFLQTNLKIRGILKHLLPVPHFRNKNQSVEDKLPAVPVRIYVVRNIGQLRIRNRKIMEDYQRKAEESAL